jgi:hypothetical protein
MIDRYFTTLFTVKRMLWTGESGELQDAVSFYGHIQQASMDLAKSLGLAMTKTFTLWCSPVTNLLMGDELLSNGKYYTVRALMVRDYAGVNKHIEAVIEQTQSFE